MLADYLKTLPQYFTPKHALTNFAGLLAGVKIPVVKNHLIRQFVQKYNIVMSDACEENPLNYACFNDFFIRQLKPEKRPLAAADIVSPVDGIISELGKINKGQILQAKGRYYTVQEFLACDRNLSDQFIEGRFATLYLSPKDYHRVHMPLKATLLSMVYIPGKLFSVQPTTARVVRKLFARNERLVTFYETEVGLMAMVLVGATIVGAIGTSWHGELARAKKQQHFDYRSHPKILNKGDEMGYFKLGSTVVLLFANGQQVDWLDTIKAGSIIQYGQALGKINKA
ncbi:archaetidylserine decarboxylase [Legionella gresilensis]|uniref:archaetidylserine decarboxylase n=1 Tax=Legionella gresilensis TaxID=91823 RepID=UPI001041202A|nr:archaetidylserine decarboxylase [Legionella gresilensis]